MARSRSASAQESNQTVVPLRRAGEVAAAHSEPLQLRLLGPFAIWKGNRAVGALPKKAQALLAYLAMRDGRPVPRDQLAELLWGHSGGEQARRSLRQCLMSVRAALKSGGEGALLADGDTVAIAAGHGVAIDVAEFEKLAASPGMDELAAAQALYRGEFLSGLQIASEPVAEWLLIERRKFASKMSDVLYRLASARGQAGQAQAAIADAERLTAFDPLREEGHRLLMQLLAAAGRRDSALKQYESCRELLRRELGIAPEGTTTTLAETIRQGVASFGQSHEPAAVSVPATSVRSSAAPTLPDQPSIAVLPFANLSNDTDQDYFAEGMVEDIAIMLGRVPWLFVIASSAAAAYRGRETDLREVGARLGVRYALRGSVRKSAERVRIVVQLLDAAQGRHIWADRFDGELNDVFAIQDRVTSQICAMLAPALQSVEIERAQRKPTESLTAYDLYLRAVPRFRTSFAENREAVRLLRRAIEIDPAYGAAYGFAARCYQFQRIFGWLSLSDPELNEGVRFGELAAQVGHNDSEALWMAGSVLAQLAGKVEFGRALIDRSLTLNPNSANAWVTSCHVNSYLGRAKAAVDDFGHADRLNPLDSSHHVRWNILSLAYFSGEDFERANEAADRALNASPVFPGALRMKVVSCGMLGRPEGRDHVARLRSVHPGESVSWLKAFWEPAMGRNPQLFNNYLEGARRAGLPEN